MRINEFKIMIILIRVWIPRELQHLAGIGSHNIGGFFSGGCYPSFTSYCYSIVAEFGTVVNLAAASTGKGDRAAEYVMCIVAVNRIEVLVCGTYHHIHRALIYMRDTWLGSSPCDTTVNTVLNCWRVAVSKSSVWDACTGSV